jgi:hypothetical protein
MTPLNERPTPETDHFDNLRYDSTKLFRHARKMEQERDEARRSLAERTEERDGAKAGYAAINTRIYGKGGECFELDKARAERAAALVKLDELERSILDLSHPNIAGLLSERDAMVELFGEEIRRRQETQRANAIIDAQILTAVTVERDSLKAKLAIINHIAMSLFVRSTSSEVTGEMAEIGRLSREDGQ